MFVNCIGSLRSRLVRAGALALVSLAVIAAIAEACNVPVFRFALERWRSDPYRVTVFHEGPLSAADKAALTKLEEPQEKSQANLQVRTVDVAELEEADQELLKAAAGDKFPLLTVQYPAPLQMETPVWSQPFSSNSANQLLDSPLRKELLNRLVDGETAVWLLLECEVKDKNEAAAALLTDQLAKLGKELKLPELSDLPDDNLFAKTPLRLSFSMLRVPRTEAETPLVQMLVNCEPDLPGRNDPMVFPVFGRGRALLPLIGAGITEGNIKNSAQFLVGACSCEVKDLNPGFDLLLAADWDQLLSIDGQPLPIVKTRNLPPGEAELVAIPPGSNSSPSKQQTSTASSAAASPRPPTRPHSNAPVYAIIAIGGAAVVWIVLANMNKSKPAA